MFYLWLFALEDLWAITHKEENIDYLRGGFNFESARFALKFEFFKVTLLSNFIPHHLFLSACLSHLELDVLQCPTTSKKRAVDAIQKETKINSK